MKRVLYATVLTLSVLFCTPAHATGRPCGPRADILAALGKDYREQPIGHGLSARGVIITLLTSASARTWTLLITQPNGNTCVVDSGVGWQPTDWLDYPTFGDGV